MEKILGTYGAATVYAENLEDAAREQIQGLCNSIVSQNAHIAIMPDCHAGAGCTIGTTMTISNKIIPNLVGVDIGCGVMIANLGNADIDFKALDDTIRSLIPAGRGGVRTQNAFNTDFLNLNDMRCRQYFSDEMMDYINRSVGTLGGGNHFIELDIDDYGNKYLVVHTGSRILGTEVCKYYQELAKKRGYKETRKHIIEQLKAQGREREIEGALAAIERTPSGMEYLEGMAFNDYIHDMKIVQGWAKFNRMVILKTIMYALKLNCPIENIFDTVHNYIDTDNLIMRKGAISAQEGELLAIPLNMKDGTIIGFGKGNAEWNYSAPHGAGRALSRGKAREALTLEDYQAVMSGIYTTSVSLDTIDEAPMAYKDAASIISLVADTVTINRIIHPVYNFKAGD